jgi:formylglycine-generating enzyme required for sulfatase activity
MTLAAVLAVGAGCNFVQTIEVLPPPEAEDSGTQDTDAPPDSDFDPDTDDQDTPDIPEDAADLPDITEDAGDITEDAGDITEDTGDVTEDAGDIDADAGDIDDAGDIPPGLCVQREEGWSNFCGETAPEMATRHGDVLRVQVGLTQVTFQRVTAGEFVMGAPPANADEQDYADHCAPQAAQPGASHDRCSHTCQTPRHVALTHDYWMQHAEVRLSQWRQVMPTEPPSESLFGCGNGACPIRDVNWWLAAAYANRVSCMTGRTPCYAFRGCSAPTLGNGWRCDEVRAVDSALCDGYRLPSEAEWEYAARAGTCSPHSTNQALPCPVVADCEDARVENHGELAWTACNSENNRGDLVPNWTGGIDSELDHRRDANPWNLHGMYGNVAEWTSDWLTELTPVEDTVVDPVNCAPTEGEPQARAVRGGSYRDHPNWVNSTHRLIGDPEHEEYRHRLRADESDPAVGLRLARTLEPAAGPCEDDAQICCLAPEPECSAAVCE